MAENARTIHLVSQEGEQFDVSLEVGSMSELVKTMFDGKICLVRSQCCTIC